LSISSKIIVASDYTLEREAIVKLLVSERDLEIIAQAKSTRDVKRLVLNKTKADILVLDIHMSNLEIGGLMKLIKENIPELKVHLLTENTDEIKLIEAICAGCVGYISKNATVLEFIKSIQSIRNSEVWIQRSLMAKVISKSSQFYVGHSYSSA